MFIMFNLRGQDVENISNIIDNSKFNCYNKHGIIIWYVYLQDSSSKFKTTTNSKNNPCCTLLQYK